MVARVRMRRVKTHVFISTKTWSMTQCWGPILFKLISVVLLINIILYPLVFSTLEGELEQLINKDDFSSQTYDQIGILLGR